MWSPVVSSKVKYKNGLGIPGKKSTLQREGTMCDSGITEGSVTWNVAQISSLEDGAAPTSLHPTCKVIDWEGDTNVTKTGVVSEAGHAEKTCGKGLA